MLIKLPKVSRTTWLCDCTPSQSRPEIVRAGLHSPSAATEASSAPMAALASRLAGWHAECQMWWPVAVGGTAVEVVHKAVREDWLEGPSRWQTALATATTSSRCSTRCRSALGTVSRLAPDVGRAAMALTAPSMTAPSRWTKHAHQVPHTRAQAQGVPAPCQRHRPVRPTTTLGSPWQPTVARPF